MIAEVVALTVLSRSMLPTSSQFPNFARNRYLAISSGEEVKV